MPIYALGDLAPLIHESAYVHPDAVVIGNVTIGAESTVWPTAVLRGDFGIITVGARTSIQDGAVIHTRASQPTHIGDDCVIGHNVHIEGSSIGNATLIGSGSTVLPGCTIGNNALVGAQALVSPNTVIPDFAKALGVPARIIENSVELGFTSTNVAVYVDAGKRYKKKLRLL